MSEHLTTEVQQDQELPETKDSGSNTIPSITTTTILPLIQSGPEDSPQVTECSNSNSSTLLESICIGY